MISLIITVKNENKSLASWLESIARQSRLPEELVIVDGGSTDGTWEQLQQLTLPGVKCVVAQKSGNISTGRNEAIRLASGEVLVVTDAGCIYDKNWFQQISAPFAGGAEMVATGFGPWLEATDSQQWFLIAAATTPAPAEFDRDWLPSSRSVAFTKKLWQTVGGYPEWIPICEDIIYDLKIKKAGYKIEYVREPLVFWRPRASFKAYFLQLFRYTRSDGHGKLWLRRQLIRYAVYFGSIGLLYLALTDWRFILLIFIGLPLYIKKFWQRYCVYAKNQPALFRFTGLLLMPAVIAFGDLAKLAGWPVGVYERLTKKIIFEQY